MNALYISMRARALRRRPPPLLSVLACAVLIAGLGFLTYGCTAAELDGYARQHPTAAPATRAVEAAQARADRLAEGGIAVLTPAKQAAAAAADAGVPAAGQVAGGIGLVIAALWGWLVLRRRKRSGDAGDPADG